MIPFIEQARFYAAYHQKAAARYAHMAAIPLIILSLMILLGFVRIVIPGVLNINLASIVTLVLLIYYFRLQWHLALALTPVFIILLWIAEFFSYDGPTAFSLWAFVILAILGVVIQCAGHVLEGKRPALVDNAWQTLIAPLCLTAEIFFLAGRMTSLRNDIHGTDTEIVDSKT